MANPTTLIKADTKCKVPRGQPGFPVASVNRGIQVIVNLNEITKTTDHDFSKVLPIPGVLLTHDLLS